MRRPTSALVLGAVALAVGCTDAETSMPLADGPTTTIDPSAAAGPTDAAGVSAAPTPPAEPVDTVGVNDVVPTTLGEAAPPTTFAVTEVPDSGVPGLDSTDVFCAAWSRFGGSWQVLQVAANFGPDPAVAAEMEVMAAPVIAASHDAMFAAWPDELAGERDAVADGFFGPLDRRADVALAALADAGADGDDLAAIGAAWVSALSRRDPADPVLLAELDERLASLVAAATGAFTARLIGIADDPSMRITVATPSTDAYLATGCPDQGALAGTEVDSG